MKVLGLDLSTHVGHCVFKSPTDPAPFFDTIRLPKPYDPNDIGKRTLHLRLWLRDFIYVHKPDVVAFESPLIMMGTKDELAKMTTAQTMRLQISLAAEVETTALECDIHPDRLLEVATSTAKVALAGTARLGKDKKKAMLIAATRRGWRVSNDHEADAGAVAMVAYQHLGFDVQ